MRTILIILVAGLVACKTPDYTLKARIETPNKVGYIKMKVYDKEVRYDVL